MLVVAVQSALFYRNGSKAGKTRPDRKGSGGAPARMQDAVTTIDVAGAPERPAGAGGARWRLIARNAFPFLVVGAIWEIVAWAGVFPHQLFPTLEDVALSFVQLTVSGILPHHAIETVIRLLSGFALASVFGVSIGVLMGRSRRAEDIFLPLVSICAPIPGLAYTPLFLLWFGLGQFLRRAAGRLRLDVSDHLQQLDRREGGEGNLGALGAIHGRRQSAHVPPRHPAGRTALHPHRAAARPGAGLAHPRGGGNAGRRAVGARLADLRRARVPQYRRHAGRRRGDRRYRPLRWKSSSSRRSRTTPSCAGE